MMDSGIYLLDGLHVDPRNYMRQLCTGTELETCAPRSNSVGSLYILPRDKKQNSGIFLSTPFHRNDPWAGGVDHWEPADVPADEVCVLFDKYEITWFGTLNANQIGTIDGHMYFRDIRTLQFLHPG